ncbi:MAG: hypothetical protein A3F10_03925 [Coxiella sp. RIFCSPHIGHO2_12_FULL_42_15]|nr:MAG: hypothetical protein A3F10_03925 [Coxiella sp. RIFCSPHIGHO2_12_FULL_42_15]
MRNKHAIGFSLLEVLLAGFLLSVVLLGIYTRLLEQRANLMVLRQQLMASLQLNNLFDQLRLCKNTKEREQRKKEWEVQTRALLPSIMLQDAQCHDLYCQVCIFWKNRVQKPSCLSALLPALPYWN